MSHKHHEVEGGNGSPWWLKAVYTIGVPSAIALYLVYYVTTGAASDHDQIIRRLDRSERFWAQICRNTAKAPEEVVACNRIERGDRTRHFNNGSDF